MPQVLPYIKSYQRRGSQVDVLQNENGLYKWYASLIKNINSKDQSSLKNIAEGLVEGTESEEEKNQEDILLYPR